MEKVPERTKVGSEDQLKVMCHSGLGWVQHEMYFCLGKRDLHELKVSRDIRQMKRDLQGLEQKRSEEV